MIKQFPDISEVDVIIGYRAGDSYFSFAQDFVNNTISVRDLNQATHRGTLGEQVVLISEKAFCQIVLKVMRRRITENIIINGWNVIPRREKYIAGKSGAVCGCSRSGSGYP